MQIQLLSLYPYEIPLSTGQKRSGNFLCLVDDKGTSSWGDIAPLPNWSKESLEDSRLQLELKQHEILSINWTKENYLEELFKLKLLPSNSFGLESALFPLFHSLTEHTVPVSALLMGSFKEILKQAALRKREGYTSAKLKVSNLTFEEASQAIHLLKDLFRLRIDVNRAWSTSDSLLFFSKFPLDTFDYVEEPFQNPHDLHLFLHPLAVDESFPQDLSLLELENLPTLKALIYKPTIQGGMLECLPLSKWCKKRNISLVLSSSFESDLGLAHIASMARRLSLTAPSGIGTYHYLNELLINTPLRFSNSLAHIPSQLLPKKEFTL